MPEFVCQQCHKSFAIPEAALEKYPGWTPRLCRPCRHQSAPRPPPAAPAASGPAPSRPLPASRRRGTFPRSASAEQDLPVAKVLELYHDGPLSGVFTDGAANPNPGPGGWGVVYVDNNSIIAERYGHEPATTNNRMELTALLAGIDLVPSTQAVTVFSDSMLCINTFTLWVTGWEARGWKRKEGPIKNLDLVREIHQKLKQRPNIKLAWIAAHNGYRWNEYADALATAYRRQER